MRIKEKGFTLIELVIVIVLLGILAATALPRFLNVISSAKSAAIQGVASSLSSAVNITHAQWLITNVKEVDLDANTTVTVSTNGWPQCSVNGGGPGFTCTNAAAVQCVEVWDTIMENPPKACDTATTGCQYIATSTGGICTYTLQGLDAPGNKIVYDFTTTGSVTVQ